MFSSVTSRSVPLNAPLNVPSMASIARSMGSVRVSIPRLRANDSASSMLPRLEKGEGIKTPSTFDGPSASTAIAAVNAESIPPDRPSTTREKPHLRA
jgi:hypothetical protein